MAPFGYVYIQSHLDSAMLHLDVASRQIDLLQKVLIHASMILTFLQICMALNIDSISH